MLPDDLASTAGPVAETAASPTPGLRGRGQVATTIKVDAERLGLLVDTIGELAIAQSMVQEATQTAKGRGDSKLVARLNRMAQITRDLHSMAGMLRLIPLARTFEGMQRVLRDVAKKTGRRAQLKVTGEQTELDKALVDAIGDPLMHMVRNAVDHGLERTAEERIAAGKPVVGTVELRATQRAGSVVIEVIDDGRGLDREKILQKARARGLVSEGRELSDREVFDFICSPGFSTADKVTDVSGRGVGMDVVKQAVEALSGSLEISSVAGRGSTFAVRVPLTLAVMDGMVLRVANERFIIPISVIIRSVQPKEGDVIPLLGRGELLRVGTDNIPLMRLDRMYNLEGGGTGSARNRSGYAVIVEVGVGQKMAVLVDDILGQQQIVIKTLGEGLGRVPTVSGGAIMPDGKVGLILDVDGLFQLAIERDKLHISAESP